MAFRIAMTGNAERHLRALKARERRIVQQGVAARLLHAPTKQSRSIKRLRYNAFAQWELRLGQLRVLYNADEDTREVTVLLVGHKIGNRLIVAGKEFHGHESDTAE